MLHPLGFSHGERFSGYYFTNVIGNPLDTSVALHYIIFNGLLEKFPNLKIFAVHGGGFYQHTQVELITHGCKKRCKG